MAPVDHFCPTADDDLVDIAADMDLMMGTDAGPDRRSRSHILTSWASRLPSGTMRGDTLYHVERNWHRRPTVGRHNRTLTLRLKAEQIFWQPIALLHSIARIGEQVNCLSRRR